MNDAVLSMRVPGRGAPSTANSLTSIPLKTQQEMKSAVHHELIKRMDLEKLAFIQENRAARLQLLSLIQQLIGEQGIPLSAVERDRVAAESWMRSSGWGRWSRCCRTQR